MGVSRLSIGSNCGTGAKVNEHGDQVSLMARCFPWFSKRAHSSDLRQDMNVGPGSKAAEPKESRGLKEQMFPQRHPNLEQPVTQELADRPLLSWWQLPQQSLSFSIMQKVIVVCGLTVMPRVSASVSACCACVSPSGSCCFALISLSSIFISTSPRRRHETNTYHMD